MTFEQYCNRIFKAYGSGVRDIFHAIRCYELGAHVIYSFKKDVHGVDMLLNNIPVYSFTNTDSARIFAEEKQKYRHKNLRMDKAIMLIKNNNHSNGIHVASDCALQQAIDFANNNTLNGIKEIIC